MWQHFTIFGKSLLCLLGEFDHPVLCLCRLEEILDDAEDMAIDVPHFWLYLAELITPMIREGGIPMGQLLR